MARYKPYDYDQLMMVPISLEDQLMPGTLEYAIHHVVEEHLDLSIFDERYSNDETGRKAIAPKVLIKIVLFGYSRGLITSRSLECACRENITFMSLACGQKPGTGRGSGLLSWYLGLTKYGYWCSGTVSTPMRARIHNK
jgi:transposase